MNSRHFLKAGLAAAALLAVAVVPAAAQTTTVYSNNFSNGAGPDWSDQTTDTTPGTSAHPADAFLGQLGNETETLSLNNLAPHSTVTATFDLYIINTMDGNGPFGGGPDPWSLTENGNTLIATNFANFPGDTQSFGGSNGSGGYLTGGMYADQTGATEKNTLGYPANDAVYHLSFTFTDPASLLALNFVSGQNQGIGDESWGLDNVVVKTDANPVPEASTTISLGLLLCLGGLAVAVKRRRAGISA